MYTLPKSNYKGPAILAMDPGSKNMGISVVGVRNNKPVVLANRVMDFPVKGLTKNLRGALDAFMGELAMWVDHFKPGAIIAERFQSRGLRGTTVEEVSIMLGAVAVTYRHIPVKLVTAVTWKGPFQKRFGHRLDDVYKFCKTTPHQFDASLIGVYGFEKGRDVVLDFDFKSMILQTEASSLTKLHDRKARKK